MANLFDKARQVYRGVKKNLTDQEGLVQYYPKKRQVVLTGNAAKTARNLQTYANAALDSTSFIPHREAFQIARSPYLLHKSNIAPAKKAIIKTGALAATQALAPVAAPYLSKVPVVGQGLSKVSQKPLITYASGLINPKLQGASFAIGAGLGALSGRNWAQAGAEAMGRSHGIGGVLKMTTPAMQGLGPYVNALRNPNVRQLVGRGISSAANVGEGLIVDKATGMKTTPQSVLLDATTGALFPGQNIGLKKNIDVTRRSMQQVADTKAEQLTTEIGRQHKGGIANFKDLTPNEYDSRHLSLQRIAEAQKEIKAGKYEPVVVDRLGNILDGHHHYEAYKSLGFKEVPIAIEVPKTKIGKYGQPLELKRGIKLIKEGDPEIKEDDFGVEVKDPLIQEARKYKSRTDFEEAIKKNINGAGDLFRKQWQVDNPKKLGMYDIWDKAQVKGTDVGEPSKAGKRPKEMGVGSYIDAKGTTYDVDQHQFEIYGTPNLRTVTTPKELNVQTSERFTPEQITTLSRMFNALKKKNPNAKIVAEIGENSEEFRSVKELSQFTETLSKGQGTQIPTQPSSIKPGQRQKGFLETVETSPKSTTQTKQIASSFNQGYERLTNKESFGQAVQEIARDPGAAHARFLSNTPLTAYKSAEGLALLKKYEADKNDAGVTEILEAYDRQLRAGGQGIQIASLWNKLSPRTVIKQIKQVGEKHGFEITPDVEKNVVGGWRQIQAMPEGAAKDAKTLELLDYVAEKMPLTKGELFESYRIQNMLSSPKTFLLRNPYYNLFQTFITRPAVLGTEAVYDFFKHPFNPVAREVSFSDFPAYYKNVWTSMPNAFLAAKEVFKQGYNPTKLDVGSARGAGNIVEGLRRSKTPLKYSAVPRFMEATDKFMSTMIASGEYNRLLKNGVEDSLAKQQATELAERYLLREKMGSNQVLPAASRALDALGNYALAGRRIPVVGGAYKWYVPFISTPINAGKWMLETSPLGFVGKKPGTSLLRGWDVTGKYVTRDDMAKAFLGTVTMGIGAILAAQGRTTGFAPSGERDKTLFYGDRGPLSVAIPLPNGKTKWVPMWYFGPFAFSLALPTLLKERFQDNPKALTDSKIDKTMGAISDISRFIASQTPLQGVGAFYSMLDGDTSFTKPGQLAFTLKQVIPAEGFMRWANNFYDNIYRKGSSFEESLKKDIPFLSKQLEPYRDINGEPSKRDPMNQFLPYDVKTGTPETKATYEEYRQTQRDIAPYKQEETEAKTEQSNAVNEFIQTLKQTPVEQRRNALIRLAQENPTLAKEVIKDIKERSGVQGTLTPREDFVKNQDVAVRSKYVIQQLKELQTVEQRKALIIDWRRKGIITDAVMKSLVQQLNK